MLIKYIRTPFKFKLKPHCKVKFDNDLNDYFTLVGNDPIGVIVAISKDEVGWSLCNSKDTFEKKLGKAIAENRAIDYGKNKEKVLKDAPISIQKDILAMYDRAKRYFK